jgi:tetratricopeptide (TPR) repeat protein
VFARALDDAVAGHARLVLLSGEPGIGKTRLCEELGADARRRGVLGLWGNCYEGEGAAAFWPWVQILRAASRLLDTDTLRQALGSGGPLIVQLVPELRERLPDLPVAPALDSPQARFRLFDSVARFLEQVARNGALLLVLDDLHGADRLSLSLLEFLAHELRDAPVLIVGVYRDLALRRGDVLSETFGELLRVPRSEHLALAGLSAAEVAAVIQLSVGVSPAAALVAAVHKQTEGNPLFVTEYVRTLLREQDHAALSSARAASVFPVPERVQAVIDRRLARLSATCRRVLRVAAVIGREFGFAVLAAALLAGGGEKGEAEAQDVDVSAALDEAWNAGVVGSVSGSAGRYRFTHALIRQALYDALQPGARAGLHHRVATVIEATHEAGEHLAELAHHFFEAAQAGREPGRGASDRDKAVHYAQRAGDKAAALLAYEEAIRLYQLGLNALQLGLAQADRGQLCQLLLRVGNAYNRAAEVTIAKEWFLRAAAAARTLGDRELLSFAALAYGGELTFPEGGYRDDVHIGLLEEAIAAWGDDDHPLHARLLGRLATALYFTHAAPRRAQLCARGLAMARRLDEPATLSQLLQFTHAATWGPNPNDRLSIAQELLELARRLGDRSLAYSAHHWRFCDALDLGDRIAVDTELRACRALAGELRQPQQVGLVSNCAAALDALEGRFGEAERAANDLLVHGQWIGRAVEPIFAIQLFVLRNLQGRQDEMIEPFRALVGLHPGIPALRAALALLFAEVGRHEEALAVAAVMVDAIDEIPWDLNVIPTLAHLGHVCALAGDAERARIAYERLRAYDGLSFTIGNGVAYFGAVSYYLGFIEARLGRDDEAGRHFEDALVMHRQMRAWPWVALTQYEYAALLVARCQPDERERARELLTAALATARELGMRLLETRAQPLAERCQEPGLEAQEAVIRTTNPGADDPTSRTPGIPQLGPDAFHLEGGIWTIAYAGRASRMKDSRGLQHIAYLLRHAGREIHVLELIQVSGIGVQGVGIEHHKPGTGEQGLPVLDAQAKGEYRRRLHALQAELEEAEHHNDPGSVQRTRAEMEMLSEQLAAALGLGGRDRPLGAAAERARTAVTKRIKEAIGKIGTVHPALAEHLKASITTGYFCAYTPMGAVPTWHL